ncbi:hypothetical protein TeGR_g8313, partial [Tetraparma gracilis]
VSQVPTTAPYSAEFYDAPAGANGLSFSPPRPPTPPPPQLTHEQQLQLQQQHLQDSGTVVYVMGSFFRSVTLGGAWLDVRRTGVPVDPINLHVDMMRIKEGPAQQQMDAVCDCSRPNGGCCCAWRLAAVGGHSVDTGSQVSALGEECLKYEVDAELAFVKEHQHFGPDWFPAAR